jgi:hypothetical protein
LIEEFHHVLRLVEQMLQAASLQNNSLCFLAEVSSGCHCADELGSMGSTKVLLEKNSMNSHERWRRESSKLVSLI